MAIVAGVIIALSGTLMLASLIALVTGISLHLFFPLAPFPFTSIPELFHYWFANPWLMNLAMAGLLLTIGIPLLLLTVFGIGLIFQFPRQHRGWSLVALLLWIIGVGLLAYALLAGMNGHYLTP